MNWFCTIVENTKTGNAYINRLADKSIAFSSLYTRTTGSNYYTKLNVKNSARLKKANPLAATSLSNASISKTI